MSITDTIVITVRAPRGTVGQDGFNAFHDEIKDALQIVPNAQVEIEYGNVPQAVITVADDTEAMYVRMTALSDRISTETWMRKREFTATRQSLLPNGKAVSLPMNETYRHREDGPALTDWVVNVRGDRQTTPDERFFLFGLEMMNRRDLDMAVAQGITTKHEFKAWRETFYAPGVNDELRGRG